MEKNYIVKSFEEEVGIEIFLVTSDKSEKEVLDILKMGEKYATVDDELEITEGICLYDEYYEKIIKNNENGLSKFKQYVEFRGLKIKPLEFDFEFIW